MYNSSIESSVSVSEHSLSDVRMQIGPPGFWSVMIVCSCGQQHFWLVLQEEVDLCMQLLGDLRNLRKQIQNDEDSIPTFRVDET